MAAMTGTVDIIFEHLGLPKGSLLARFKRRAESSWKTDDINKILEEDMKPKLGIEMPMTYIVEIGDKQNNGETFFYNFDNQYILDYDPFGSKTDQVTKTIVLLRVKWSQRSQDKDYSVATNSDSQVGPSKPTVPVESTLSNAVEQGSSTSTREVRQSKVLKRKREKEMDLLPIYIVSIVVNLIGDILEIKATQDTYNSKNIPLISNFNNNERLEFIYDINISQRVEYLSNEKRVRQKTNTRKSSKAKKSTPTFRKLVPIQGDKTLKTDQFERALPILKIPDQYNPEKVNKHQILCAAVVREYEIDAIEIGYHIVGNRRFALYPNAHEKGLVEYCLKVLTTNDVKDGLYNLLLHMIQMPNQLNKIVGDAFFKIKKQPDETVDIGFKIGERIGSYRLAIFGLKETTEPDVFEPNFETLCLSDYFHQT